MRIKYNRVSTISQSGDRFLADVEKYDKTFFDTISGTVAFKDRPDAKNLIKLIEANKVNELVIEEFSRLGRNTGDVIQTLSWLDKQNVNVVIRNLGLQSRPNGKRNPIWNMISSVMSSLYEMELGNILERTSVGRLVYVQQGGTLGRPVGTTENNKKFLDKPSSQRIVKALKKGMTIREVAKVAEASTKTVMKVKSLLRTAA